MVLILVISLSVMVVIILLAIIGCVVRRRHKDTSGPPETGEVCHNLMPGAGQAQGVSEHAQYKCVQPLPPPPTLHDHFISFGTKASGFVPPSLRDGFLRGVIKFLIMKLCCMQHNELLEVFL